MKRKKGQAAIDFGVYSIYVLLIILILVIAGLVMVTFNSVFSGTEFSGYDDVQTLRGDALETVTGFDIAILICVVGFAVIIFLTAFFFENAPVFFSVFFAVTLIMMLVTFPFVNGVYDFINDAGMAGTIARMPLTSFVINNWAWVIVAYICSAIVGFAAKAKAGEEGGGL